MSGALVKTQRPQLETAKRGATTIETASPAQVPPIPQINTRKQIRRSADKPQRVSRLCRDAKGAKVEGGSTDCSLSGEFRGSINL
jgi:hypothetical protein